MVTTRVLSALALGVCLLSGSAHAVPAFARQTGMSCSQCHTVFPELTPFGRQFKAGGYTFSPVKQVAETGTASDDKRVLLEIPSGVPLGVMMITSISHTALPQQISDSGPAALNDDFLLPQQFSFFYAGKIAPKLGAFIQLTYEGPGDHFGFDNSDIRLAHTMEVGGKSLIIGATINNNPTVSDLWNTTPAWGVPFTSSSTAPSPSAGTLIEGKLAQSVLGAGVYGFYNGMIYAELDFYKSSPIGMTFPLDASTGATNVIDGVTPYWRLAVEKSFGNHTISVGTFGLRGVLLPGGTYTDNSVDPPATLTHPLVAPGDTYTDVAFDSQYQWITEKHIISAGLTYIHEAQSLEATNSFGNSDNVHNELHSFKATAMYVYDHLLGGRAIFSTMRGSSDATLYGGLGPQATTLSGEVFYTPWHNVRLALAYTAYVDFDGGPTNIDGKGRNAFDNNTLYGSLWLAF